MKNNEEKIAFRYTYSANQQAEIQHIREKYLPQEEDNGIQKDLPYFYCKSFYA